MEQSAGQKEVNILSSPENMSISTGIPNTAITPFSLVPQIVHFPKYNKSEYLSYGNIEAINMSSASSTSAVLQPEQTLTLVGEKGYRTALASHGFTEGCYYFEVEILQPQLPLPFMNAKPAIRIGFTCLED